MSLQAEDAQRINGAINHIAKDGRDNAELIKELQQQLAAMEQRNQQLEQRLNLLAAQVYKGGSTVAY